ncbi:MAG: VTT domain-containing protein [Bacteroidetes bacterium]|nr:VTT domain-containing protein [Bacteroidota bacterium]
MQTHKLDEALSHFVQKHDILTYALLCTIIFCETGLVITPFLPGDSLLFAAGAVAATVGADVLNPMVLILALLIAAISGDHLNYFIGKFIGKKANGAKILGFTIKEEYLEKTHKFYEKNGAKTLIIARFVPIVRTFAPFVAGVGQMSYIKFLTNCFTGGLLWVCSMIMLGYFLGSFEFVKKNFEIVVFIIIGVSLLPVIIEFIKAKTKKSSN